MEFVKVTVFILKSIIVVFILIQKETVDSFNVDTANPIFYSHDVSDSYFGFSVTLHRQGDQNMLFVGAPKAQSSFLTVDKSDRGGALFKCPIDTAGSSTPDCSEVELDTVGHEYSNGEQVTNASDQWLGATLASGGPDGVLVICRPRFKKILYPGTTSERRQLIGGCFVTTNGFGDVEDFSPCSNSGLNYYTRARCQLGISAAVHEDKLMYGAPGSYYWNGNLWYTTSAITSNSDYLYYRPSSKWSSSEVYYYGHSVAFGNFKGDDISEFAVSAPRHNHGYGRVYLFDDSLTKYSQLSGSILGAYFGHTLAVSDLNNDGYEDLVIALPLYSDEEKNIVNGWEVGAIYIYYNDNQGGFIDEESIIGTEPGCRFGYSMAALGDINRDGYNDLAVGAPYCAGGDDGKIFIYHGTGKNLPLNHSPKQTLKASTFGTTLSFFGFSISAGLDIDGNTYPDLAVGAFKSQNAVILRSRAVVSADATISSSDSPLDLAITNTLISQDTSVTGFNITVCISYDGQGLPEEIDFGYEVLLDSARQEINRRAVFVGTETTSGSFEILALRGQHTCSDHEAFIIPSITDKQTPISISLTYQLREDDQGSESLFPVLDETSTTQITSSISFKLECANVTCYPDLSINATTDVAELVVGTAQDIFVDIVVNNKGEDAFLSILDIAEVNGLYYVQVDRLSSKGGAYASCSYSATTSIRSCDIGNPISASDTLTVGLHYQTEEYSSFSGDVKLNLTVRSSDDEKAEDTFDNFVTIFIPVYAKANLTLSGTANPENLILQEVDYPADRNLTEEEYIGPEISHDISLTNIGPSFIGASEIEILFPMRLEGGEVLLNLTSITTDAGDTCEYSTRKNNVVIGNGDSTSTFIQADCDVLPECYVIICPVDSLGSGDNAARSAAIVTITARVNADAALANDSFEYIDIVSTASAVVEGSVYQGIAYSPHPTVGTTKVQTRLSLEFEQTAMELTKETPLWVYLVSALGGLVILIVIIVILYMLGFFKRKKISPEQQRQLRESRRSRKRAGTTDTILTAGDADGGEPNADVKEKLEEQ